MLYILYRRSVWYSYTNNCSLDMIVYPVIVTFMITVAVRFSHSIGEVLGHKRCGYPIYHAHMSMCQKLGRRRRRVLLSHHNSRSILHCKDMISKENTCLSRQMSMREQELEVSSTMECSREQDSHSGWNHEHFPQLLQYLSRAKFAHEWRLIWPERRQSWITGPNR